MSAMHRVERAGSIEFKMYTDPSNIPAHQDTSNQPQKSQCFNWDLVYHLAQVNTSNLGVWVKGASVFIYIVLIPTFASRIYCQMAQSLNTHLS